MADEGNLGNIADRSVIMEASIDGVSPLLLNDQTFTQVILTESLLSPSLQCQIFLQDVIDTTPIKIYDYYKGANFILSAINPHIRGPQLDVNSVIFRLENRKPVSRDLETYILQATHKSVLINQQNRITKWYYKKTPTAIVDDALGRTGAEARDTYPSTPVRDYQASNVHPFEVINDQANYALDSNDPSFLHFMTYRNRGTHHFESVLSLTSKAHVAEYTFSEKGPGQVFTRPFNILSFEFPCEFDLLSDIMNGVGGGNAATSVTIDPMRKMVNAFGPKGAPPLGSTQAGSVFSNKTSPDHNAVTNHETPQQYRAARLALLKPDRISLRITVAFNPALHAGSMIRIKFPSGDDGTKLEFGSGDYLIVSLTHKLRLGGLGLTDIDLVARSVGNGEV